MGIRNTTLNDTAIPKPPVAAPEGASPALVRELEETLAPVALIMHRANMSAHGFMVTITDAVYLGFMTQHTEGWNDAAAEKLLAARAAIRREAERTIGLYALPDALLVLRNVGVRLLADDTLRKIQDGALVQAAHAAGSPR